MSEEPPIGEAGGAAGPSRPHRADPLPPRDIAPSAEEFWPPTAPGGSAGDGTEFARPEGTTGPFAERPVEPRYSPPPPTVPPDLRAEFGRPTGAGAFAPLPGERINPERHPPGPPISLAVEQAFGRSPEGTAGFDPAPGSRLWPTLHKSEYPWWKPDAVRDPWRDPRSPFWLGRAAVFARGQLEQVDPDLDVEREPEDLDVGLAELDGAEEPTPKRDRRRFGMSALLLTVLVAIVAGAVGGGAGYWLSERAHNTLHRNNATLGETGTPANRPPGTVADIAKRVLPSVVSIDFRTATEAGVGSGVIIDKQGDILTNNHVISTIAISGGTLRVTFPDKATQTARIVGRDPTTDLAVLKVDRSDITVAALGNSNTLAVGDPVVAIGSPLGLQGTVTSGIVSALNRPVHLTGSGNDPDAIFAGIQTDAAINPGSSGGALVDASGAVVGVNTAGAHLPDQNSGESGNIGLGFAIPINYARTIAQALIRSGKVTHASLGISARTYTDGPQDGAYLAQVTPGGPADKARLKAGDVVVAMDGTLIDSGDALTVAVLQHKPGDKVSLRYIRSGKQATASVTLGSD
jgi:S1-C subfamily serine protease